MCWVRKPAISGSTLISTSENKENLFIIQYKNISKYKKERIKTMWFHGDPRKDIIFRSGFWIRIRNGFAFLESLDPEPHFLEFLDLDPDPHSDPDPKFFFAF